MVKKCQSLHINNSELYPQSSDTGWSTVLPCFNAYIKNSTIYGIKRDGNYVGMNLENINNVKILLNNMLVGKSETNIAQSLAKTISNLFIQ